MKVKVVFVSEKDSHFGIAGYEEIINGVIFEQSAWIKTIGKLKVGKTIVLPKGAVIDRSRNFAKWVLS